MLSWSRIAALFQKLKEPHYIIGCYAKELSALAHNLILAEIMRQLIANDLNLLFFRFFRLFITLEGYGCVGENLIRDSRLRDVSLG